MVGPSYPQDRKLEKGDAISVGEVFRITLRENIVKMLFEQKILIT